MNKLFLLSCFVIVCLFSCEDRKALASGIVSRDTTITPANSVTNLHVDSVFLGQFLNRNVQEEKLKSQLLSFYNSRNYQYAWFDEDGLTEHAEAFWNLHLSVIEILKDSSIYNKWLHDKMESILSDEAVAPEKDSLQTIELALTLHFFKYIETAFNPKVSPEAVQWYIPRRKVDEHALIDSFLNTNMKDWKPRNRLFFVLQNKISKYIDIQRRGNWPFIGMKKGELRPGAKSEAITQLKKRLSASDDFATNDTSDVYTPELENSVKKVQQAFGLKPSGVVDMKLINELNVSVKDRIEQMMINLERMRWFPVDKVDRLVANIPEFKLHVFEKDSEVMQMNIVVGKAANRTVIFSDELQNIVFSPYWNVPTSIVRNEILPAMQKNKTYLSRNNMEITGYSNGLPVVRQKPGKGNALGKVKFLFPNRYNIYFHDTPAKTLFEREVRAFSHGCIRLQRPFDLAQYLLRNDKEWTSEKITEAMNRNSETWVKLKEPVPVFIIYLTCWVDAEGLLNFRDDIYGHDERMKKHLFE